MNLEKKCPGRGRFPLMLWIAGMVVLADQLSKRWMLDHFHIGESRRVTAFLYLTLVQNTGTAFGRFGLLEEGWEVHHDMASIPSAEAMLASMDPRGLLWPK